MKLYEIDAQQREIDELLAANDGVLPDDFGSLLELNDEAWRTKLTGYAKAIKAYTAESKAFADEIKALQARKKTIDTRVAWLKSQASASMQVREVSELGDVHKLLFTKSKSVEVASVDDLPSDYIKVTTEADKTAIGKALKAGHEVAGATLVTNQNLQVR
jgi:hypothetical protein